MVSPGSTWLLTSCLLCLLDLTKVSSNFLLCHVCGCPGGLDASMEKCSGSCKDESDLGRILPCPSGACHSLSLGSQHGDGNVTFKRNCFDKVPDSYLKLKNRTMGQCYTLSVIGVVTTECLCDKNFCNSTLRINLNSHLLVLLFFTKWMVT